MASKPSWKFNYEIFFKEQNAFFEVSFAKVESKNIEMQEPRDSLGVICLTPSLYG